ncbi:hypothetical protein ACSVDE_02105 [Pseudalkalibacillus sp. Hm43]|uniref:hypothetical protein n=1 Tax=Pseudalkalibacillus sp. Hm43 TaxID=3450742 RepID=UPI003F43D5A9
MKKFVVFTLLVGFVLGASIYWNKSCHVFRSDLIKEAFTQAKVIPTNGEEVALTKEEVSTLLTKINNCPRKGTQEMSFPGPDGRIVFSNEEESVSVTYLGSLERGLDILYSGHIIRTEFQRSSP